MIAPAPALKGGGVYLDEKFASGMELQASLFPGVFDCILRESTKDIPFSRRKYEPSMGFGLTVLDPHDTITADHLRGYDVVFCSADDQRNFYIADVARSVGAKLTTTLEYTFQTRLQIALLDNTSVLKKGVRMLRLVFEERRRRAFLSKMDAIQANGYPALETCRAFDPQTLLFLDNRMEQGLFASDEEMAARRARLIGGEPLALVFSGRLEPMKGVQDLVPIAAKLKERGVPFTLDIYGEGSLKNAVSAQIDAQGLANHVTLRGSVDFETELVPALRQSGDLFLCCHGQADPSCTYIESNGCGMAIVGYDNAMWKRMAEDSQSGWVSAMGNQDAMADCIQALEKDRYQLAEHCARALEFAKSHDFHTLSKRRMDHLAAAAR